MSQQQPNTPVQIKFPVGQPRPGTPSSRPSVIQLVQRPGTPQRLPLLVRSSPGSNTNTAVQYLKPEEAMTFHQQQQQQPPLPSFMNFAPHGFSLANSAALMAQGGGQHMSGSSSGSRKPCNCTKSNCLKLYCECFAQGQLCQNCNCSNCMNNLAHEDERRRAVKMTLERNPAAFNPKIGRGEGERRHTKGCNCKRSGCLKNYCECYEAKISCSDMCRCQSCKNTEDSIERRSLLRLAALGSYKSKHSSSYKKHLQEPAPETLPHSFLTWEVIEALVSCLLAQADDAERRDLPAAVQERLILEEFGRSLDLVIKSASKALVRNVVTGGMLPPSGPGGDDVDRFGMRRGSLEEDDLEEDLDDDLQEKFRPPPTNTGSGRRRSVLPPTQEYLEEEEDLEEDLPGERDILRRIAATSERSIKTEAPDEDDEEEGDNLNESFSKPVKHPSGGGSQARKPKAPSSARRQKQPSATQQQQQHHQQQPSSQSGSSATPTRTSGRRHVPSKRFNDEEYQ